MASDTSEPPVSPDSPTSDYIKPEIDECLEARAYFERENEIIALDEKDGKLQLAVSDGFFKQWRDALEELNVNSKKSNEQNSDNHDSLSLNRSTHPQENKILVVSLLGNTSVGKSFIAKHLICGSVSDETISTPLYIEEAEKKGATTLNVNCYVTKSAQNNKTLILDYEGEKGSAFPLLFYARRGWEHVSGTAEKAKIRREAITEYFPKLAYILSDVVILLGNDDLASTDYLHRCQEFALRADAGVDHMPSRPLLVIIQNKSSLVQSTKTEDVTQKFFEIHGLEANSLKNFFCGVKCFCFPHCDYLQRIKGGKILDGREIFDQQMIDLRNLLDIVWDSKSPRLLTHTQWLYLILRVLPIVQSGKSVSLHMLLNEIVGRNIDQKIQVAIDAFLMRYSERPVHSPQWFHDCCQFTMKVLAHSLAVKLIGYRELLSEQIIHEQCEFAMQVLFRKLDEFQPCEAVYMGRGRSSKDGDKDYPVFCYQHKAAHQSIHRTCQPVHGLTLWKKFLNWVSTDTWPGMFATIPHIAQRYDQLKNNVVDLSNMVKDLRICFQEDPKKMYCKFIDLFRNCKNIKPTRIFRNVCFCSEQQGSLLLMELYEMVALLERQLKSADTWKDHLQRVIAEVFSNWSPVKCETCYEQLVIACEISCRSSTSDYPNIQSNSEPFKEQPECTICYEENRNFLLIPCGHRGFCEKCADHFVSTGKICPYCKLSVTGRQRVYDLN